LRTRTSPSATSRPTGTTGGYVFHGTRVTGLTAIYRRSGGSLKTVMAVGGHTSSKTALRYQRAELDYQRTLMEIQSQEIEEQGLGKSEVGG